MLATRAGQGQRNSWGQVTHGAACRGRLKRGRTLTRASAWPIPQGHTWPVRPVTLDLPYSWTLLLGLGRVVVVSCVLFLVLTRFALPGTSGRSAWEGRGWGDAVLGLSATLIAASVLGLLGLFDAASLAATLALALAGGAVLRYRRLWRRTVLHRYADLLRWTERLFPATPVAAGLAPAPAPRSQTEAEVPEGPWLTPQAGWWIAVGLASVLAAGVRLVPALAQAAPFTIRFYAHLETLKGFRVGAPVGTVEGWGVHALAMALGELARVDPALVLRCVGAVSAAAITYGVYQTARFYWGGRLGAFAGALFVAAGGPLLPLPLDRQAGAEPLMLAAALALPVFPHLAAYLGSGERRGLAVGVAGLVASGLVYPTVGALLGAVVAVYVATIGLQVAWRARRPGARPSRYRDRGLWRRMALLGGGGAVLAGLGVAYVRLVAAASGTGSFAFFDLARGLRLDTAAVGVAGALGVLVVAAPFVPGRARFADTLPRPGALLRTGGQTLAMLALWLATGAGYDGISGAAAVLLMTAVGLDLALVVTEVEARVAAVWPERWRAAMPPWSAAAGALAAGVVVITTGWSVPVPGPTVEPDGFVEAYLDVSRESLPYAWTAVGHSGTRALVAHRGRFMDYEYFLENYDPAVYDHRGPGRIPTPEVFLFTERPGAASGLAAELLPSTPDLAVRMRRWVEVYRRRPDQAGALGVFYQDSRVTVYRVARPAPTLLDLGPDADSPARRPVLASAPGRRPPHAPQP